MRPIFQGIMKNDLFEHIFKKNSENWAKCGKNDPFIDKFSLKQDHF